MVVSVDTLCVSVVVIVVGDSDVVGDAVVTIVSPVHATGNVDGQVASFGWKQALVLLESVQ